jgi:anti-anti-sigma factor
VEYIDSSALGMLLVLRDKAKESGKSVRLVNCHGMIKQVLDIAHFERFFEIS